MRFLIAAVLTVILGSSAAIGQPIIQRATDIDARAEDGNWTFYSLREGTIIPPEDSTSTNWDLAFKNTMIRPNGGISGPGDGALVLLRDTTFHAIRNAPLDSHFRADTTIAAGGFALPNGSGNGWYEYDLGAGLVLPLPHILVVRTADGRYAKMQIESYYQGAPENPDPMEGFRYYTFSYFFQPNGSRVLQTQ